VQPVLKSLRNAARGLSLLIERETNAKIHLAVTAAVALAGLVLPLSTSDWLWLIAAAALVWTAEALNTALEILGDAVSGGNHHPVVGKAKDVAAAGVLLAAMGAALIGVIILLPQLFHTFGDRSR
jgi:diacylglycerol kinase (ATP)